MVRIRRRDVRHVGAGVGLHLEKIVRFIFEDIEIVLLRHGVDFASALDTLCGAGGVLARGNCVEKKRFLSPAMFAWRPVAEEGIHVCRKQALCVHFDAEAFDAKRGGGFERCAKGVFFCHQVVTASAKGTECHLESGGGADIERALPILIGRVVYDFCVFGDEAQQLDRSGSLAVIKGYMDVIDGFALGGIMFAGLNKQTRVPGLCFGETRWSRDFDLEVLERENGTRG